MKIGIMGGTFNPIHVGHLTLAQTAKAVLQLDEIWFIPTGISYSKAHHNVLPGAERLKMAMLAVNELNGNSHNAEPLEREITTVYKCLDIEIKREGYTYSYETLEQLKEEYPDYTFFFLVGADCLFSIENWKNPERFFKSCILAAALRGDMQICKMEEKKSELEMRFNANVVLFPFEPMDISSTDIRRKLSAGECVAGLVPDSVIKYIEEKGFYLEEDIHCS